MKPETITNDKAYFQCKQLGFLEMKKIITEMQNNNNNNGQVNSSLDATEIESMNQKLCQIKCTEELIKKNE